MAHMDHERIAANGNHGRRARYRPIPASFAVGYEGASLGFAPKFGTIALRLDDTELLGSSMKVEGKPPFDPKLFLARVGAGKTRTRLGRRQIVFSQGEAADAVFYIEKGKIELRVLSQQGKEAILATLGVDDFFGEGCLAGQPLRMATAVAVTECSIMRLEKSAMIAVLHEEAVFSALFISYLLTRNMRIEEDLVDQLSGISAYETEGAC
jgi:CRP-like cAMP-binding protein